MVSYRVLVVVIPGYCWLLVGLGGYRVLLVVMYRLMYGCRGGTGFIPESLVIQQPEGGML